MQKTKTAKGAGFVLIKPGEKNKILVMLKPDGVFDIPKGHKDNCDINDFATAQRECFEEVNIFVSKSDLAFEAKYRADELVVFCAVVDQEPKIKKNPDTGELEHIECFWVDPETAIKILPNYLSDAVGWCMKHVR